MHWDISILRTATACIRGGDMLNLNRFFDALADSLGYEGYVSLECLRIPDGITAAREGLKYLLEV